MSTTPSADWYPDPGGSGGERYWDGAQWTDQVRGADGGETQAASDDRAVAAAQEPSGPTGLGGETIALGQTGGAGAPPSADSSTGSSDAQPSSSAGPSWAQGGGQDSSGGWASNPSPAPQQYGGYGGATGGPPPLADVGPRFLALLLDGLIVAGCIIAIIAVLGLLGFLLGSISDVLGVIVAIIGFVLYFAMIVGVACYQIFAVAAPYGQTIGMSIAGVRCVSEVDAQPIDRGKAFVRWLVQSFVSGFFLLGYIWAFFDDQNRTWHDMVAGTRVVQAEKPGPGAKNILVGAFKGERQ